MSELNLFQLKAFYVVAKHLNFTRAAKEMSLSQPAVSRQVASLEKSLGLELFIQRGRRVELTDAGRNLYYYSDRIFEYVEQAEQSMSQFKDLERGKVLIGACTTVGGYVLPPLLKAFQERYPNINIVLRMGNSEEIERLVAEREIDLGLIGGPLKNTILYAEPYFQDELVMISSSNHFLKGRKNVKAQEIAGETLIWREQGSASRFLMEQFFADNNLFFSKKMEIGCTEVIKRLVAAGVGITFISRHAVLLEQAAGLIKIIDSKDLVIPILYSVIFIKDQRSYPTVIAFLNFIRKWPLPVPVKEI